MLTSISNRTLDLLSGFGAVRRAARHGALLALLVGVSVPMAVGCADQQAEDETGVGESDIISRVQGSTLGSAYAKGNATYLSVRSISTLAEVGALDDRVMNGLASRVDGIIANQPSDGRISVQELLKMEKPGFIETLFPEEKAALPKIWALLETTAAAPTSSAAVAALPKLEAEDVSIAAGTLAQPSVLNVVDLPAGLQLAASRIELSHNSDNDPATITLTDVDGALANTGPYTPDEVEQFDAIAAVFKEKSVSSISSRVKVPAPFATSKTVAALGSTAKLRVDDKLEITESRSLWFSQLSYPEGQTNIDIRAHRTRQLTVEKGVNDKVVVIFEGTEREAVLDGNIAALDAGTATFEVWSGGARTATKRVKLAALASSDDSLDLSAYADYAFFVGNTPLVKNVATATSRSVYNTGTSWGAEFVYGTAPAAPTGPVDNATLKQVATPTTLMAGRYEAKFGNTNVRFEVSPTGAATFTMLDLNTTQKANIHSWREGAYFVVYRGNTYFRVNAATGMADGWGGQLQLKAADRTG
jgi:hypothetical protein